MSGPLTLDDLIRRAAPPEAYAAAQRDLAAGRGYDARRAAIAADFRARYGDRSAPVASAYRAAESHRGELLRPHRGTRRERATSRAVFEAYRRRLVERGMHDAAPRVLTPDEWSAGQRAAEDWREAVLELPPLVALAVSRAARATGREVHAMLRADALELAQSTDASVARVGRDRLARLDALTPSDDLAWDMRRPANRKVVGALAVLVAAAERTERPGYSHVVSGVSAGLLGTALPNAAPYQRKRGTGKRPAPGDAAARYGVEAMVCADVDASGIPRGVLPVLRLWSRHYGLGLHSHQPHGGTPGLLPAERGPDGRWAFSQYWWSRAVTLSRVAPHVASGRRRRRASKRPARGVEKRPGYVHAPEVLEWLGRSVGAAERAAWSGFEAWMRGELATDGDAERARIEAADEMARRYAEAEAFAVSELALAQAAARAGDVRAADTHLAASTAAGMAARSLRMLATAWFGQRDARRRLDAALGDLGALDASRALARRIVGRPPPD